MKADTGNLRSALGLGAKEHIAIVGGGGKSTLLFTLAEESRRQGLAVVTTTTTKIRLWEKNQAPAAMYLPAGAPWEKPLKEMVKKHGHVFVSREALASGKVAGIPKALADALFQAPWVDHLLVEADGAAGRPVKTPGPHEPVIPGSATVVIAVMGLEAVGAPCSEEHVFRLEQFKKITGLQKGDGMTPEALIKVFIHPEGLFKGSPEKAQRIGFLNKTDILEDREAARRLARDLVTLPGALVDRVVLASLHEKNYMIYSGDAQ